MVQITCHVIAINQDAARGELRVFSCYGRRCLGYFMGWARVRGPTLAACSMHLIEWKVNIRKNGSSSENAVSSSARPQSHFLPDSLDIYQIRHKNTFTDALVSILMLRNIGMTIGIVMRRYGIIRSIRSVLGPFISRNFRSIRLYGVGSMANYARAWDVCGVGVPASKQSTSRQDD